MEKMQSKVNLPRYEKVKCLILKNSSPLRLKNGINFRVCNICSKRLPLELTEEHRLHLKYHEQHWKIYMVFLSKLLEAEIENDSKAAKFVKTMESEDEDQEITDNSTSESEDELNVYNVVDSLQHSGPRPPPFTTFEHILTRKFTHDKNPIRKYREITDWIVAKQCNVIKFNNIVDQIGDRITHRKFYASNSEAVSKISRLLCPKKCYYLPGECFFIDQHASGFKELMKKELHDRFNPALATLLSAKSGNIPILQYNENHQPLVADLCDAIGFNTKLDYNSEGYLDLNYDLFCEELWNFETPLFVLEENKVLDVIYALLSCASPLDNVARQYMQSNPGLNAPVLSVMMHGPDMGTYSGISEHCETELDERRSYFKNTVSHKVCRSMRNDYHWMFRHDDEEQSCASSSSSTIASRQGPASLPDQSIVYPCNLGHWHECRCEICNLSEVIDCKYHKMHLRFNLDICLIKQAVTCPEHKLDHPDNVQPGDIIIQKNILFHNKQILKNGRNYEVDKVALAGLQLQCMCCKQITDDHFRNHLTTHPLCELCLFEMKTMEDKNFWKKVCNICGKKFDSEHLKYVHKKKHDTVRPTCEICGEKFSQKYNFQRHLVEQHNVFLHANNGPYDGTNNDENYKFTCSYCNKEFKYERNVVAHINTVHFQSDDCECKICGTTFTRRSSMNRHLAEQHGIVNVGLSIHRETTRQHKCKTCDQEFKRRSNLTQHEKIHMERESHTCPVCNNSFSSKSTLKRHQTNQHEGSAKFECTTCGLEFNSFWHLDDHSNTHLDKREVFPCPLCTKQYLSRWNLQRHIKLKH